MQLIAPIARTVSVLPVISVRKAKRAPCEPTVSAMSGIRVPAPLGAKTLWAMSGAVTAPLIGRIAWAMCAVATPRRVSGSLGAKIASAPCELLMVQSAAQTR